MVKLICVHKTAFACFGQNSVDTARWALDQPLGCFMTHRIFHKETLKCFAYIRKSYSKQSRAHLAVSTEWILSKISEIWSCKSSSPFIYNLLSSLHLRILPISHWCCLGNRLYNCHLLLLSSLSTELSVNQWLHSSWQFYDFLKDTVSFDN